MQEAEKQWAAIFGLAGVLHTIRVIPQATDAQVAEALKNWRQAWVHLFGEGGDHDKNCLAVLWNQLHLAEQDGHHDLVAKVRRAAVGLSGLN
jgi:hypothetical protein